MGGEGAEKKDAQSSASELVCEPAPGAEASVLFPHWRFYALSDARGEVAVHLPAGGGGKGVYSLWRRVVAKR